MTIEGRRGTILCGIDDSPGARAALEEALRMAARRGARLRVLAVYEPPETWGAWGFGPAAEIPQPRLDEVSEAEQRAATDVVNATVDRLRDELPVAPAYEVSAVPGRPVDVLVEAARDADALVLGHRGLGAVGSIVMGSTSLGCVLHATCPVTVVPTPVAAA